MVWAVLSSSADSFSTTRTRYKRPSIFVRVLMYRHCEQKKKKYKKSLKKKKHPTTTGPATAAATGRWRTPECAEGRGALVSNIRNNDASDESTARQGQAQRRNDRKSLTVDCVSDTRV